MNLQIGDHRPEKNDRKQKPPPNYYSRPVQYKLLALVGMVMLVLVMMNEARKPENYAWMGLDDATPTADVSARERSTNGRQTAADDTLDLVRNEAWAWILQDLEAEHLIRLQLVLNISGEGEPLADDDKTLWSTTIERLEQGWRQYLHHARSALEKKNEKQSPPEGKKYWLDLLSQLEIEWHQTAKPSLLKSVADETSPSSEIAEDWYDALDFRLSLMEVRDDTHFRDAEKKSWHHFFEILDSHDQQELSAASHGSLGFLQLAKQSDYYRGKLVTIRGEVRGVRRETVYSTQYYAFWVRPDISSNSPVLVYALELPPGFPKIDDPQGAEKMAKLNEKVEFTGFFFKSYAYRATDRNRIAPLVLAKGPTWQKNDSASEERGFGPADLTLIIGIVIAAAVVGTAISLVVYLRGRRESPSVEKVAAANAPKDFHALEDVELNPGVDESLRRMSQEKNPPPSN